MEERGGELLPALAVS